MTPNPIPKMTPEEFLEFERASDMKHEYRDGEIFAMSGAGRSHNLIALNVGSDLHRNLREPQPAEPIKASKPSKHTSPKAAQPGPKVPANQNAS
ncbi:MAG: Uma2 family endonuclease [Pyrinomonadaceae bacterium]